ncbi:MAG: methyltransferase domain-containing protein [Gammaproteobacteria bacterium]
MSISPTERVAPAQWCSADVVSDQSGPHPRLQALVQRHRDHVSRRPLSHKPGGALAALEHERAARGGAIVLDSGCGTGESSLALARAHPAALVIGVDKSAARLARAARLRAANLRFLRSDVVDVWAFARARGWTIAAHHLLYPNPWPKQRHLMRRWHGHPALADIIALGGQLELRTNWRTYAEEFALSLRLWTGSDVDLAVWHPQQPISGFERKYLASGHTLYRVTAELSRASSSAAAESRSYSVNRRIR